MRAMYAGAGRWASNVWTGGRCAAGRAACGQASDVHAMYTQVAGQVMCVRAMHGWVGDI